MLDDVCNSWPDDEITRDLEMALICFASAFRALRIM